MNFSSLPLQLVLLLFTLLVSQLAFTVAQEKEFTCVYCSTTQGNYTSSSTYSTNLKKLLSLISSNTKFDNGFYNISVGQNVDKVYGIGLCRGDLSADTCQGCLQDATNRLINKCPNQREAIGYYLSACTLRYSDRNIFKIKETSPNCSLANRDIPEEVEKFVQIRGSLLDSLKKQAAAGDSRFATGVANWTASKKLYALAQCTPDLSSSDCSSCLEAEIKQLQSRYQGATVYGPSCNIEYEDYHYFDSAGKTPLQFAPPSDQTRGKPGKGRGKFRIWIIVLLLLILFLMILTSACYFVRRRKRKQHTQSDTDDQIRCVDSLLYDFNTIQVATDNFSDANRLGDGSGDILVYKGVLPSGQELAVMRLLKHDRDTETEFNNEVQMSPNLQHRNLVKLLGFCVEKDLRFLIYEFLPNRTLDFFLNDPVKRGQLDWQTRAKIILGISRGLLYLHEDSHVRVIHRDLNPSNIHLGIDMNPKIANFRQARLLHADQTQSQTSIVKGTYGYMPPEVLLHGNFSPQSDVYSFGVILLNIISGKMVNGFLDVEAKESLLSFAWAKWLEGKAVDIADQKMPNIHSHKNQIVRYMKIALLCVQENPSYRPTISVVVAMLNSNIVLIPDPSTPRFVIEMDQMSSTQDSGRTNNWSQGSLIQDSMSDYGPR